MFVIFIKYMNFGALSLLVIFCSNQNKTTLTLGIRQSCQFKFQDIFWTNLIETKYYVFWITFRYLINSSISDKPNRKLRTTEIKKLKIDLAGAIRGKEYEKASKIQAKIDNLEKKDNEKILQGKHPTYRWKMTKMSGHRSYLMSLRIFVTYYFIYM